MQPGAQSEQSKGIVRPEPDFFRHNPLKPRKPKYESVPIKLSFDLPDTTESVSSHYTLIPGGARLTLTHIDGRTSEFDVQMPFNTTYGGHTLRKGFQGKKKLFVVLHALIRVDQRDPWDVPSWDDRPIRIT